MTCPYYIWYKDQSVTATTKKVFQPRIAVSTGDYLWWNGYHWTPDQKKGIWYGNAKDALESVKAGFNQLVDKNFWYYVDEIEIEIPIAQPGGCTLTRSEVSAMTMAALCIRDAGLQLLKRTPEGPIPLIDIEEKAHQLANISTYVSETPQTQKTVNEYIKSFLNDI